MPFSNKHKKMITYKYNDGGRAAAGFSGHARDCVVRSIAIASGLDYAAVYRDINTLSGEERGGRKSGARTGVFTKRQWFRDYMTDLGWVWHPTMSIGSGCQVHLRANELPASGAIIVSLSKHYAAVIDGVLHDTHDCSRSGTRCVYGYWAKA